MIILGFELTSQGNSCVRVSNDHRTESFTIVTNKNLPVTHTNKHVPLWNLSDKTKRLIETEIENYVRAFGSETQKQIVFGRKPQIVYSSEINFNK